MPIQGKTHQDVQKGQAGWTLLLPEGPLRDNNDYEQHMHDLGYLLMVWMWFYEGNYINSFTIFAPTIS